MVKNFSLQNLDSLGFEIDAPWGDKRLPTYSFYVGQGMTIHVVNFTDAYLEVDGKIKEMVGVKNVASLTSALLLFGCKVNLSKAVEAMNSPVLATV